MLEDIHFCTQMPLPDELLAEAARLAIEENPNNARVWHAAMVGSNAATMSDIPSPLQLALPTGKMWDTGRTLNVQLFGGSDFVRGKVEQFARSWAAYANVVLQFVADGATELRIGFEPGGSWSYVGTDNLGILPAEMTMNFGWFNDQTPDDEFSRTVIHEFGHALGCIHEHQSPAESIPWDIPKVYAYYQRTQGWTPAQVDQYVLIPASKSSTQFSAFDPQSIMLYPIPAELTTNGFQTGWNTTLSATDERFIGEMYPFAKRVSVAFQANDSSHWLYVASSPNGDQFPAATGQKQVSVGSAPAAAVFKGKLYLAFQANDPSHLLYVTSSADPGNFPAASPQSGISIGSAPALAVFNDRLYVAFQANDPSHTLYVASSADGTNFGTATAIETISIGSAPALAVFNDRLYVAFQANDSSDTLYVASASDGVSFGTATAMQKISIGGAPAMAAFNGKLYIAFQANDPSHTLYVASSRDGAAFGTATAMKDVLIGGAPGMAVFNGRLCIAFQANDPSDTLYVTASEDGTTFPPATPQAKIAIGGTPAIVDFSPAQASGVVASTAIGQGELEAMFAPTAAMV